MNKAGQGNLSGSSSSARLRRAFADLNIKAVPGQVNGGCQSVGAASNNHGGWFHGEFDAAQ